MMKKGALDGFSGKRESIANGSLRRGCPGFYEKKTAEAKGRRQGKIKGKKKKEEKGKLK